MTKIKKIKGTDYSVTNTGKVLSEYNGNFKWLKPSKSGLVSLCINGKVKYMQVHRLVAMAFVPVTEKYTGISIDELDVHHINFNHNDNLSSNLMWLSKAEHRQLHSDRDVMFARRKGENNPMFGKHHSEDSRRKMSAAKKGRPRPEGSGTPPRAVVQYTKNGAFIAEYASTHEAERRTNIAYQSICSCCRGKLKSAGGFKWKYAA